MFKWRLNEIISMLIFYLFSEEGTRFPDMICPTFLTSVRNPMNVILRQTLVSIECKGKECMELYLHHPYLFITFRLIKSRNKFASYSECFMLKVFGWHKCPKCPVQACVIFRMANHFSENWSTLIKWHWKLRPSNTVYVYTSIQSGLT